LSRFWKSLYSVDKALLDVPVELLLPNCWIRLSNPPLIDA